MNIVYKTDQPKKLGLLTFLEDRKGTTVDINKEHARSLRGMKLHGQYFVQQEALPNINPGLSRRWLKVPYLRYETESLLCATQEQVLAINYVRTKIWGTSKTSTCRLCKEQNETVSHIVSGCKILCATQYMYRHNQVAKYLYWNILRDLKINVSES